MSKRHLFDSPEGLVNKALRGAVATNYTGDCLHFGLANEKANAKGRLCHTIICGDDVSVGKSGSMVGRRGLAGQIAVLKVMGAASGVGASLDDVYDLGVAFSQHIVSMAATLDHCHVPGRAEHAMLAPDEVEIGTGPHNEPGYKKLSPAPTPAELVRQLLRHCLDQNDPDRGYVKFGPGDETVLLVSNFGGMSLLETGALVDEVLEQLARDWKMEPSRVYAGFLETSLNAPAFSLSVINVSAAANNCRYSVDDIKAFLDARTDTTWESVAGSQVKRRARSQQLVRPPREEAKTVDDRRDVVIDPAVLEKILRNVCNHLVQAEPDLTRWDTVMGDGDCGETLKMGATSLLAALDQGLAKPGSIVKVLLELEEIVESKMGGTLGGILGIFFVSLRAAVENNVELAKSKGVVALWAAALSTALESLHRYTPAKVGDRTVMDTLIPLTETMNESGFDDGVRAAVRGAEATKTMKPRLGRATYVGAGSMGDQELPPDPGAWGAMVVIRALHGGL